MKVQFKLTGKERKKLVDAISKELNLPADYLGTPTFSYQVGGFTIDKSGTLEGEDNKSLINSLEECHGFKAGNKEFEDENNSLTIEMPLTLFSENSIENLKRLVANKEDLIKKALGVGSLPIIISKESLSFPWFHGDLSSDEVKAYSEFISALCQMAVTQKRVNVSDKVVENEKYAFRCFLLRLGFIGADYKIHRKILLSKLTGSSAFRDGLPANKEG